MFELDYLSMSLAMIVAIGVVNVAEIFFPGRLTSQGKWVLSFVAALAIGFVPAELNSFILEAVKNAIGVAFGASGVYKLFQVASK